MKQDICPICQKEINLALPHSYSRELGLPIHRECSTETIEINESLMPEDSENLPF